MKKHLLTIIIIGMFIIGFSVLLYPAISQYINAKHASKVIADYNDTVSSVQDDTLEKMLAEAADYNNRLYKTDSSLYEPELVEGYEETLDITGSGVMGYIDIDKLDVELPLFHGVSKEVLQIGVGHLEGTSLPVGGESTHCVLSGHRGLPSAKLFTNLNKLEVGDRFTITIFNKVLTYEVDQIKIVRPSETDDLQIVRGKDYCTLMTCTPYGINTHRLLVRGARVDDVQTETKAPVVVKNEAFKVDPLIVMPVIAIPILVIVLILLFIYDRKKDNKD